MSLPPFGSAADGAFEKEEGGGVGVGRRMRVREGGGEEVVVAAEMGGVEGWHSGGGMWEGRI